MTGPVVDPLESPCVVELPPPVGRLALLGSNGAFTRFRQITRARGLGRIGPSGAPQGIELRRLKDWRLLDEETLPLLVWALAQERHPQLTPEQLEAVCTLKVQEPLATPVLTYLSQVLIATSPDAKPKQETEEGAADPPTARRTPRSSTAGSGPTP